MIKGIYVHVPFCLRKCFYCDFISGFPPIPSHVDSYFEALERELKIIEDMYDLSGVETIYFGGGTPSLFPEKLEIIADRIAEKSREVKEVTVEANPSSEFKPERFRFATRISFGIQSFSDKHLKILGRDNPPRDSIRAVDKAKRFFHVNGDLLFGLPEQLPYDHLCDMKTLVSLDVEHISCYLLELHEGTKLHSEVLKGNLKIPDDVEAFFEVQGYLEACGFVRYEVSNFARPSFECRHNLTYWNRNDFIGLGVSAWSKVGNVRYGNTKNMKKYIESLNENKMAVEIVEDISGFKAAEEIIFLGLRKIRDGVSLEELEREGVRVVELLESLRKDLSEFLYINEEKGIIRLKPQYIPVIDDITIRFILLAEKFYMRADREETEVAVQCSRFYL